MPIALVTAVIANITNQMSAPRYEALITLTTSFALNSLGLLVFLLIKSRFARWLLAVALVVAGLPLADLILRFEFGAYPTDLFR